MNVQQFKNIVIEYYTEYGRHDLPWRKKHSAYYVVVSEIMLQQTQVERVIPFFKKWIQQFPNWKALASAPQSQILVCWKGLGYNSRALRLQKLARIIVNDYKGKFPSNYKDILALPGVGAYTAGAIKAFVFNEYIPIIETNIRRVYIHHFFSEESQVSDKEIFNLMESLDEIENPREWYWALMDYGAQLPKIEKYNPNQQSKHYTKQSRFKGSDREIRGKILDILLKEKTHSLTQTKLFLLLGDENERYKKILQDLEREGFIKKEKNKVSLC